MLHEVFREFEVCITGTEEEEGGAVGRGETERERERERERALKKGTSGATSGATSEASIDRKNKPMLILSRVLSPVLAPSFSLPST